MAFTLAQQFFASVKQSTHILICTKKAHAVDGIASSLALALVLEARGKRVDVACEDFIAPATLGFLPHLHRVQNGLTQLQKFVISLDLTQTPLDEMTYAIEQNKLNIFIAPKHGQYASKDVTAVPSDFKYDLIIMVDAPDYSSLGGFFVKHADFFYHRPTINIDNEPTNEQYGNMNIVDIAATSSAEIIYDLCKESGEHFLTEDIATFLLAGMIAKTKSFKTPNVTPKTLVIASELVAAGGRRGDIVQHLYKTKSVAMLKLWGRALARLKYDPISKFAWTLLVRQDFVHAGADEDSLPHVIDDLLMNSPEAEVIGVIYERSAPTGVTALISTEKHPSALSLMSGLNADGNHHLARVNFTEPDILNAEKNVVNALYRSLGKTRTGDLAIAGGAEDVPVV